MSGNKPKELKLSVKALVEFSARRGDLFAEAPIGPSAKEGITGHKKLQNSRSEEWQKEVSVKQSINHDNVKVTLSGRIDLLNKQSQLVIIEEIKTTYVDLEEIPPEKQILHQAQAEVYAYLYALQTAQDYSVSSLKQTNVKKESAASDNRQYQVTTTWYNLVSNREENRSQLLSTAQLEEKTLAYIDTYVTWYQNFRRHKKNVMLSASKLKFPFNDYRPGQHYFSKAVYQTIKDKNQLLVEAPTGSGKTMSTLFASCKAIGETVIEQIVYLTAKGSAQETAIENMKRLTDHALSIDYLVLQAKDKACPCRSTDSAVRGSCDNGNGRCHRTIGFFDRLPEARLECLKKAHLDSQAIQTIAENYQLCPFELSLQMVRWSSVIICDFNYFLDPMVRLSAFDDNIKRRALLIDEFHNLVDRARNMYSGEISTQQARSILKQIKSFPQLKAQVKNYISELSSLLEQQTQIFALSSNNLNDNNTKTFSAPPESIKNALILLLEAISNESLSDGFAGGLSNTRIDGFHEWLKSLYRYYFISELYGEQHVAIVSQIKTKSNKSADTELKLLCLDPAEFLTKKYKTARALIGFSATVTPFDFYSKMTGLSQDWKSLQLPAVFPVENQLTLRCDFIDTRWQHRRESLENLSELLATTIHHRPGKYLVFLPSYEYLAQCHETFTLNQPLTETVIQSRNSSDGQRKEFLDAFFESPKNLVGFAILGGVFGEGVDFRGDSLTGVIIIGAGMPQPSAEQKLIESHLESKNYNAYQFAYQFPGFTRVKQTAGRVIRSESDKGVVVLVDPRFQRNDYQQLMPEHWHVRPCKSMQNINCHLEQFWNDKT